MAEIGKLTIAVKLGIDKDTALTCLKIAEMYANQIGANVDVRRDDEGEIVLEYKGIGLPEGGEIVAEFQEVMKKWQRMCKSYKACENCPVDNILVSCYDMPWIVDDIPKFEATIMKWATEHPEPVYPTWGMWLAAKFGYDLPEIIYEPIPADVAQMLGIEPKEG